MVWRQRAYSIVLQGNQEKVILIPVTRHASIFTFPTYIHILFSRSFTYLLSLLNTDSAFTSTLITYMLYTVLSCSFTESALYLHFAYIDTDQFFSSVPDNAINL